MYNYIIDFIYTNSDSRRNAATLQSVPAPEVGLVEHGRSLQRGTDQGCALGRGEF